MANRTPTPARTHLLAAGGCSPGHVRQLVDELPDEIHKRILEMADRARQIAFLAEAMFRENSALEDELKTLTGTDDGDLFVAIQEATEWRIVDDVAQGLFYLAQGDLPEKWEKDETARGLMAHAADYRHRDRLSSAGDDDEGDPPFSMIENDIVGLDERLLQVQADGAALARRLGALESEVFVLRRSLGEEVRTRRVVVIAEDGFERVVAESDEGVKVYCRGGEEHDRTYIGLLAEEDPLSASLYLSGAGNGYGSLGVWTTEGRTGAERWPGSAFAAELALDQPNGNPGIVVDSEGLKLHRMRLLEEWDDWNEKQEARRRAAVGVE